VMPFRLVSLKSWRRGGVKPKARSQEPKRKAAGGSRSQRPEVRMQARTRREFPIANFQSALPESSGGRGSGPTGFCPPEGDTGNGS
jgi:hypothetical protein